MRTAGHRIVIVHPAGRRARAGNRVTALRWAVILRHLGHRVRVEREWSGDPCDLLIALHATKTLDSIRAFRAAHEATPVIVAGTGTDLYETAPEALLESLRHAARVIVLQPLAIATLPEEVQARARVLYQSVRVPPGLEPTVRDDVFEVAVIANLRAVKAPLLPARAAAALPAASRILIVHAGAVLDPELGAAARALDEREPRYAYLGPLGHGESLELIARARLLVIPSRNEGGANVLSEALALGKPILATRVPGTLGVLGSDHPGLFAPGDESALAGMLLRAEQDPAFLEHLTRCSSALASLVAPEREVAAWRALLGEVLGRQPRA